MVAVTLFVSPKLNILISPSTTILKAMPVEALVNGRWSLPSGKDKRSLVV